MAPDRQSPVIVVGAALAFVNLVVLVVELVMLVHYDALESETSDLLSMTDVWASFALALLARSTVTGGLLLAWPRSRTVGVGVLLGTLGAVVLLGLYLFYVLASR